MPFVIGTVPLRINIDKVDVCSDLSVSCYLIQNREEKLILLDCKVTLLEIIDRNINDYPIKKYGGAENTKRIIDGILEEICLEEVQQAIHWFQARGINKCINYLLDCVS